MSCPVLSSARPPISAMASGAQLGVPSPDRAGTHHGARMAESADLASAPALIAGQSAAPSIPSRRSHVVTDPALGTNPSMAYVVCAPIRHAQVDTTPARAPPGG